MNSRNGYSHPHPLRSQPTHFVWLARLARPSLKMRTISLRSAQIDNEQMFRVAETVINVEIKEEEEEDVNEVNEILKVWEASQAEPEPEVKKKRKTEGIVLTERANLDFILPDGWRCELVQSGEEDKIRQDKYFYHDSSGVKVRSKIQIERIVNFMEENGSSDVSYAYQMTKNLRAGGKIAVVAGGGGGGVPGISSGGGGDAGFTLMLANKVVADATNKT